MPFMTKRFNRLHRIAGLLLLVAFMLILGHVVFGHCDASKNDLNSSSSNPCPICHFVFNLVIVFISLVLISGLGPLVGLFVRADRQQGKLFCGHISVRAPPF